MEIALALIGSGALSALISGIFSYLLARKAKQDEENSAKKAIVERLDKIDKKMVIEEKDNLRTQLLVMIADYPQETSDILRLGEHYFVDLKGNWILSNVFARWARENGVALPDWYKED